MRSNGDDTHDEAIRYEKNLTGVLFAMLLVAVPMLASANRHRWRRPPWKPPPPRQARRACRPGGGTSRAPVPNKGDTAWMIVATVLVILMTIPGLALFYGGLVRSKTCCRC